jgi:hypothetical protein
MTLFQYQQIAQPTEVLPNAVVPALAWFLPLSTPVLRKDSLPPNRDFFAINLLPIQLPATLGNWYEPFRNPVRLKPGLLPALQEYNAQTFDYILPPVDIRWYAPLPEPVRLKPGLATSLQQFLTWEPRLLPNPQVTGTMAATEINADAALFGVYVYNPTSTTSLQGARVSITIIPAISGGNVSVEG